VYTVELFPNLHDDDSECPCDLCRLSRLHVYGGTWFAYFCRCVNGCNLCTRATDERGCLPSEVGRSLVAEVGGTVLA
jgi:hypothetical protein